MLCWIAVESGVDVCAFSLKPVCVIALEIFDT